MRRRKVLCRVSVEQQNPVRRYSPPQFAVSSFDKATHLDQSSAPLTVQEAMQWWQAQHTSQLHRQADNIHNVLLQELFSVRRSLELNATNPDCARLHQEWLTKIEGIQRSLEILSYELSPPYLEEALPLAIQYEVEQWKVQYPNLKFGLSLPLTWVLQSNRQNEVIVRTLGELLRLGLPKCDEQKGIALTLERQERMDKLELQICFPSEEALNSVLSLKELGYLKQVFELLAPGEADLRRQGQTAVWYFSWQVEDDVE